MQIISLAELMKTTTTAGQFKLGTVASVFSPTYGALKAIRVYSQDALTVVGAPCYPVAASWPTSFTVDEDENVGGVVGQEVCIGPFLSSAAVGTAFYGWVLIAGLNPVVLTTDGNLAAGEVLLPTTTDGTWTGLTRAQLGTDVSAEASAPCGTAMVADVSTAAAVGTVLVETIIAGQPPTL